MAAERASWRGCWRCTLRAARTRRRQYSISNMQQKALSRHAYTEALGHGQRALDLLATLPASPARASQELALRLTLSIALVPTQGVTSEALAHNLQQALVLCETVEETTVLVPVLVGLTNLAVFSADRAAAARLMARERALLQRLHDPASLLQLHMQLGTAETMPGGLHPGRGAPQARPVPL